jgi:hypothetical protein
MSNTSRILYVICRRDVGATSSSSSSVDDGDHCITNRRSVDSVFNLFPLFIRRRETQTTFTGLFRRKVVYISVSQTSGCGPVPGHRLITHSLMELSPSWEVANCAATQELPSILWNPHCSLPRSLVHMLSQINPIYIILVLYKKNLPGRGLTKVENPWSTQSMTPPGSQSRLTLAQKL